MHEQNTMSDANIVFTKLETAEPTDRWKNRRAMAWICCVAAVFFPFLLLLTNGDQLAQVAVPFYLFVSSVVAAYIGFATVDDKNFMEGGK